MSVRAYAWIHFASALLQHNPTPASAAKKADLMMVDFDARFDQDGYPVKKEEKKEG